jgi:hypothetical protein
VKKLDGRRNNVGIGRSMVGKRRSKDGNMAEKGGRGACCAENSQKKVDECPN